MKLIIEKNKRVSLNFMLWLIQYTQSILFTKINTKKLRRMQAYVDKYFSEYNINLMKVLVYCINRLRFNTIGSCYLIYFDIKYLTYNELLVEDILKFIDKGNLEIDGCGIISETLFYVQENIDELVNKYSYRNGVI